jgi:hypothetical protein
LENEAMTASATTLTLSPTDVTPRPQGRRSSMIRRLAALGVSVAAILAVAAPAAGFSHSGSGLYGSVSAPVVQGSHLPVGGVYWPTLINQGLVTGRSAGSSGAQTIAASYRAYKWNGSVWAYSTGSTVSTTLYAGYQTVRLPSWTVYPTSGRGHYYVEATITWKTPAGALLGTRYVYFNQAGDYQCATIVKPCSVGTGWVYLG